MRGNERDLKRVPLKFAHVAMQRRGGRWRTRTCSSTSASATGTASCATRARASWRRTCAPRSRRNSPRRTPSGGARCRPTASCRSRRLRLRTCRRTCALLPAPCPALPVEDRVMAVVRRARWGGMRVARGRARGCRWKGTRSTSSTRRSSPRSVASRSTRRTRGRRCCARRRRSRASLRRSRCSGCFSASTTAASSGRRVPSYRRCALRCCCRHPLT